MFDIPVIDMAATGENIRRLRERSGKSVRDLQYILGFTSPQAIYKWQHGETLPTLDNLVILSAIFHVSMDEIIVVEECQMELLSA